MQQRNQGTNSPLRVSYLSIARIRNSTYKCQPFNIANYYETYLISCPKTCPKRTYLLVSSVNLVDFTSTTYFILSTIGIEVKPAL